MLLPQSVEARIDTWTGVVHKNTVNTKHRVDVVLVHGYVKKRLRVDNYTNCLTLMETQPFVFLKQVRLTKHVEKVMMFMKLQQEMEVWLEGMSDKVGRLSPVSEDSEKAKAQLVNTKV